MKDQSTQIVENGAFHIALAAAFGNQRMSAEMQVLVEETERLSRTFVDFLIGSDPIQILSRQGAIIDAVQQRDRRRARQLVHDHLHQVERRIAAMLAQTAVVA